MRRVTITQGEKQKILAVPTPEAWVEVATELIRRIVPKTIIALSGELGAGKTTAVQALARGLHISKIPQSPTFALMRAYAIPEPINGVTRLIHVDAYRIDHEKDFVPLDIDEELSDGKTVLVLEWPEKIPKWIHAHSAILTTVRIESA